MKRIRNSGYYWLILPITIYLILSYIFPLYSIFKQTFSNNKADFSLNLPLLVKTLRFTFTEAVLSTVITMITGLACAYVFSTYRFYGKQLCMSIISVPFMLPTVVTAAGLNAWLGPNGILNSFLMRVFQLGTPPIKVMNTFGLIIFAHVFYNTSLVVRMVSNAWMMIDVNIVNAAEALGAKSKDVFRKIILPMLKPSIISSALLVFLFDFTSYGAVLLLGGPKYRTIEVEISYQTLQVFDLKTAGVLALMQMAVTILIVSAERSVRKKAFHFSRIKVFNENQKKVRTLREKLVIIGIVGSVLAITIMPMLSLIVRSFYIPGSSSRGGGGSGGFTLMYYKNLFTNRGNSYFFVPPFKAIFYSFVNAILCSVVAVIIGAMICVLTKRTKTWNILNTMVLLPIGTSSVTLGLGYLIAYRRALTSFWVTPLAHSIVVLPFVIRSLQPAIEHMPVSLEQSAATLGAKPVSILRKIKIPILRRPIINSIVFSFTISIGEFGATNFLTRPERPTMPVAIFTFLSKPGGLNYGSALAMSTILFMISLISIFILSKEKG